MPELEVTKIISIISAVVCMGLKLWNMVPEKGLSVFRFHIALTSVFLIYSLFVIVFSDDISGFRDDVQIGFLLVFALLPIVIGMVATSALAAFLINLMGLSPIIIAGFILELKNGSNTGAGLQVLLFSMIYILIATLVGRSFRWIFRWIGRVLSGTPKNA